LIRIKIELIPRGVESMAETLDEVVVANDGTGAATGPNEGGWGNYEVFDGDRLAARARSVLVPFDFVIDRPRRLTGEERSVLAGYADDVPDDRT